MKERKHLVYRFFILSCLFHARTSAGFDQSTEHSGDIHRERDETFDEEIDEQRMKNLYSRADRAMDFMLFFFMFFFQILISVFMVLGWKGSGFW